jgi:hypothetical protein
MQKGDILRCGPFSQHVSTESKAFYLVGDPSMGPVILPLQQVPEFLDGWVVNVPGLSHYCPFSELRSQGLFSIFFHTIYVVAALVDSAKTLRATLVVKNNFLAEATRNFDYWCSIFLTGYSLHSESLDGEQAVLRISVPSSFAKPFYLGYAESVLRSIHCTVCNFYRWEYPQQLDFALLPVRHIGSVKQLSKG